MGASQQESCHSRLSAVGPLDGRPRARGPGDLDPCQAGARGYRGDPMVEPGLVTLAKIVGTLLLAMGIIPFLFLLSPGGDRSEPKENFDDI